jgi:hypothetical protein
MIRSLAIAAIVFCLAGCFVFDNPFDTDARSDIVFQVIVPSGAYAGTYVWNNAETAYTAAVGGNLHYIYIDGSGYWCLSSQPNETYGSPSIIATSVVNDFRALPPTSSGYWTGASISVDVSKGGISPSSGQPDSPVRVTDLLHVSSTAHSTDGWTYRWESSGNAKGPVWTPFGTGSTCTPTDHFHEWIRVIITPTSGAGVEGSPVTSPPVYISLSS